MFKDTCLIAHKRTDRSPRILDLKNPQTAAGLERDHLIMSTKSINVQQTCIINA
jgi:hypothetical protein